MLFSRLNVSVRVKARCPGERPGLDSTASAQQGSARACPKPQMAPDVAV